MRATVNHLGVDVDGGHCQRLRKRLDLFALERVQLVAWEGCQRSEVFTVALLFSTPLIVTRKSKKM